MIASVIASPVLALRHALRERLLSDGDLLAALGSAKIHDVAPRQTRAPWIAFGETKLRDWSTSSGRGAEIFVTLDVVSDQPGSREAFALAERVTALIDDADLALVDWRLVRLAHLATDARRSDQSRFARLALRFRALVETL